MEEFALTVNGRPPSKAGDRSVLGSASPHRDRVIALLRAAHEEASRRGFAGFAQVPLRLEVTVFTGPGDPPWDATNYLGGIVDVLERKAKRSRAHPGSVDHLGDLLAVGLYDDDRQIKEIVYREVNHPEAHYRVVLRALDEQVQL